MGRRPKHGRLMPPRTAYFRIRHSTFVRVVYVCARTCARACVRVRVRVRLNGFLLTCVLRYVCAVQSFFSPSFRAPSFPPSFPPPPSLPPSRAEISVASCHALTTLLDLTISNTSHDRYLEVPHTASVKKCYHCAAYGQIRCPLCCGRGRCNCGECKGTGRVKTKENPYATWYVMLNR